MNHALIVLNRNASATDQNMVRMWNRNFASAAKLNPKRLEWNLSHSLSHFLEHDSCISTNVFRSKQLLQTSHQFLTWHEFLFTGCHDFQFHLWPFVAEQNR